jgi:hypothetical protein
VEENISFSKRTRQVHTYATRVGVHFYSAGVVNRDRRIGSSEQIFKRWIGRKFAPTLLALGIYVFFNM